MEDSRPSGSNPNPFQSPKGRPGDLYQYAAPFVCADLPTGAASPLTEGIPLGGRYETRINIFNPQFEEVDFWKRIALTMPPLRQEPGAVSEWLGHRLDSNQALSVGCREMLAEFSFPEAKEVPKLTLVFREGILVIQSAVSLDVTAIYCVAGDDGIRGIEVEQINERYLPLE